MNGFPLLGERLGFVNDVREKIKIFFTGEGYNFLGSHFKGGQDFWAVNLRGAKIFGL